MKITRIADQVRNIPLREVLERYGFEAKAEGTTLRAKSDHHNIVVTGSKWFDNRQGLPSIFAMMNMRMAQWLRQNPTQE